MAGKPIGSFYVGLGLDTKEFQRKLKQADRDLQRAFGSSAIRTSQLLAASVAALTASVGYLGAKSVKLAADLEVQTKAFERLLGSADAAKSKLDELQTFAAKTPFTFTELTDAAKRLLALGYTAEEVKPVLTSIGDAAFGLGRGNEGMHLMIKAFGDIKTKGYLMTQEIRQLAENGIPAFQILAEKIGVSIPKAMEMVEDRAIDSQTAINAFMTGINERFGGMMEIQSNTMLGMWSTVVDEAENSMRIVGKQITESARLKEAMAWLRKEAQEFRFTLESKGFINAFSNLFGEYAKISIIATAGAITATMIPAIISAGIAIKGALAPLLPLITAGVLVGGTIQLGLEIKNLSDDTKQLAKNAENANQALSKTLTAAGAKVNKENILDLQEKLAQLRTEKEIQADLDAAQEKLRTERFNASYGANYGYTKLGTASLDAYKSKIGELEKEKQTVVGLTNELGELKSLYKQQLQLNDPDYRNAYAGGRKFAAMLVNVISSVNIKQMVGKFFPTLMGVNDKTPSQVGDVESDTTDKDKTNKLLEEAQRTSKSIEEEWLRQTQSKSTLLDYQYQEELKTLNESKALNKNYQRDLWMLKETYYQRGVELKREEHEAEQEKFLAMHEAQEKYAREVQEIEQELADAYFERIKAMQDGSTLEAQLQEDHRTADFNAYANHLNEKAAAHRAYLEGQRNLINAYDMLNQEAHRTNASYIAEGYRTIYNGLSETLTQVVTGAKNAGEAFKELGMQIIQMVVRWQIQQRLAAVMSKTLEAAQTAASVTMAATVASAWAPAAAMVAAATFGASTAAAGAGLASLSAMSRALAIPAFADGGIVTKPTLAMIGEGHEPEAVIPLSQLQTGSAQGANVQINVVNQTGVPFNAKSSQRTDGSRVVIDLFLEGYSRNLSGIQDLVGRR